MLKAVAAAASLLLAPVPAFAADATIDALRTRLFPDLAHRLDDPRWHAALAGDARLRALAAERRARLAIEPDCRPAPACLVDPHLLTDADIITVERALRTAASTEGQDPDLVASGWRRDAAAINRIIAVYGKGEPPRYPRIDGMSLDPAAPDFATMLATLPDALARGAPTAIDPPLDVALGLLDLNGRDEAIRFDATENAATIAAARGMDWPGYRYTAIIVPGAGPADPLVRLSAPAKLRLALAARRFHDGDAPFVIVSGGNVHPARTPVNEAVEMRRALIERFDVPANRVVLEPFARHTTTNLRNAARLLAEMGATDREALIVTDARQSRYIESEIFARRNLDELGYQPGRIGVRLSETALPFRPSAASLAVDPTDPLDP